MLGFMDGSLQLPLLSMNRLIQTEPVIFSVLFCWTFIKGSLFFCIKFVKPVSINLILDLTNLTDVCCFRMVEQSKPAKAIELYKKASDVADVCICYIYTCSVSNHSFQFVPCDHLNIFPYWMLMYSV